MHKKFIKYLYYLLFLGLLFKAIKNIMCLYVSVFNYVFGVYSGNVSKYYCFIIIIIDKKNSLNVATYCKNKKYVYFCVEKDC